MDPTTNLPYQWRIYDIAGGLFGSTYATLAIILSPIIGFSVFAPLSIAGQIFISVILDHIGFLKAPKKPFTVVKAAALIVITAGLGVTLYQASKNNKSVGTNTTVLLSIASFAAGFTMPVQVAMNATLGKKYVLPLSSTVDRSDLAGSASGHRSSPLSLPLLS